MNKSSAPCPSDEHTMGIDTNDIDTLVSIWIVYINGPQDDCVITPKLNTQMFPELKSIRKIAQL